MDSCSLRILRRARKWLAWWLAMASSPTRRSCVCSFPASMQSGDALINGQQTQIAAFLVR